LSFAQACSFEPPAGSRTPKPEVGGSNPLGDAIPEQKRELLETSLKDPGRDFLQNGRGAFQPYCGAAMIQNTGKGGLVARCLSNALTKSVIASMPMTLCFARM
jgi:hypothetical protein